MPDRAQILLGLGSIANRYVAFAIAWHVFMALVLLVAWLGWRPSRRVAAAGILLLSISVATFAGMSGNRFSAVVFIVMAMVLAVLGWRLGPGPVGPASGPSRALGAVLVSFGWLYPHFLAGGSPVAYVYAAPTGLIPCPSLAVAIGTSALLGLGSRAWAFTLASAGLFYGVYGVVQLQVWLDVVLALGAAGLALPFTRGRVPTAAPA